MEAIIKNLFKILLIPILTTFASNAYTGDHDNKKTDSTSPISNTSASEGTWHVEKLTINGERIIVVVTQ